MIPMAVIVAFALPLGFLALLVASHAVDTLGSLCKDEIINLALALDTLEAIRMVSILAYIGISTKEFCLVEQPGTNCNKQRRASCC